MVDALSGVARGRTPAVPPPAGCAAWCPGPDSNRHALRRGILSPLRLPISPPGLSGARPMAREGADYGMQLSRRGTLPQCALAHARPWPPKHAAYKTLEDAIGNTPLVRAAAHPGADNAQRGNVILGKLEGNNPAGSVKDRPALSHDPARRGARRDQARRHADRGHLRQHRHRAGHGRGDQGLPHGADHAGGPVDRARADHEGLRRRADAHAQERRHGVRARPGRADAARRQGPRARPVRQRRQPAHPLRDHRPRDLGRHRRAASRISSAPWAPPAPSPACRAS